MLSKHFFIKVQQYLFLSLILFLSSCAEAKRTAEDVNDREKVIENQKKLDEANSIVMLLPINATARPRIHLKVQMPSDFRSYLPLEQMIKSSMNEFFPKRDGNINNWSELITTNAYVAQGLTAKQVADHIKKNISNGAATSKVIRIKDHSFKDYTATEFIMAYTYQGKQEVVCAKYYSGPYDCAGFQYAIRLANNMSEEQALRKIHEFVENNVEIIE